MELTKRGISVAEKATLKSKSDYALVFLGRGSLEIKELIDAGFKEAQIIGVDRTLANVKKARQQYPRAIVRYTPRLYTEWIRQYGDMFKFSYIHLDYCSHPERKYFADIVNSMDSLVVGGRIRVTFNGDKARIHPHHPVLIEEVRDKILRENFDLKLVDSKPYISTESRKSIFWTLWFEKR